MHQRIKINGNLFDWYLIRRKSSSEIEFEIYRKPASTGRYIPGKSHYYSSQKLAAFNSMMYCMCIIPLSEENFEMF